METANGVPYTHMSRCRRRLIMLNDGVRSVCNNHHQHHYHRMYVCARVMLALSGGCRQDPLQHKLPSPSQSPAAPGHMSCLVCASHTAQCLWKNKNVHRAHDMKMVYFFLFVDGWKRRHRVEAIFSIYDNVPATMWPCTLHTVQIEAGKTYAHTNTRCAHKLTVFSASSVLDFIFFFYFRLLPSASAHLARREIILIYLLKWNKVSSACGSQASHIHNTRTEVATCNLQEYTLHE